MSGGADGARFGGQRQKAATIAAVAVAAGIGDKAAAGGT